MSLSLGEYNLRKQDEHGNTILHYALHKKNIPLVNNLIDDIIHFNDRQVLNIQNNNGDTPLHIAVRRLPLHTISNKLVALGADPTISNYDGETVEVAESLKEYFQYVKNDMELSDLDDSPEEQSQNSPVSITIVSINSPMRSLSPMRSISPMRSLSPMMKSISPMRSLSPLRSISSNKSIGNKNNISSISFPQNITIEELTPTLTTEQDIQKVLNNIPMKKNQPTTEVMTEQDIKNVIKNNNEPSKEVINDFIKKILQE